jgi:hypothetical protein
MPQCRNSAKRQLSAVKEGHETEIHVILHMAMKETQPRLVRHKIDADLLKAPDHHHILCHAGDRGSRNVREFKAVPVEM